MWDDFFIGLVKMHILHHAAQEPIYGVAMIRELRRHGYELSAGTLYPLLHGMEARGYLVREDRVVGGKVRKYYTATAQGSAALREVREKLAEVVAEVVEGRGPASIADAADLDADDGRAHRPPVGGQGDAG